MPYSPFRNGMALPSCWVVSVATTFGATAEPGGLAVRQQIRQETAMTHEDRAATLYSVGPTREPDQPAGIRFDGEAAGPF